MSTLRQLTKMDKFFLVQFECDSKFMVRSKGSINAESEINVGDIYDVQWGRPCDKDQAKICGSGTDIRMRALMKEMLKEQKEQSQPPAKKPRLQVAKRPSGKPAAAVIRRSEAPTEVILQEDAAVAGEEDESHLQPVEPTTGTQSPPTTTPVVQPLDSSEDEEDVPLQVLPDTPQPERPVFLRAGRPNSPVTPGLGPLRCQLNSIEALLSSMYREQVRKQGEAHARLLQDIVENQQQMRAILETVMIRTPSLPRQEPVMCQQLEDTAEDEASLCGLSDVELRRINKQTHNAGHFAAQLTRRLYPELFGSTNMRFHYNYYGGGNQTKTELSPGRKEEIRKTVCRFYPDMRDSQRWREAVVPKVNELLRRPTTKKRTHSTTIQLPNSESLGNASDLNTSVSWATYLQEL